MKFMLLSPMLFRDMRSNCSLRMKLYRSASIYLLIPLKNMEDASAYINIFKSKSFAISMFSLNIDDVVGHRLHCLIPRLFVHNQAMPVFYYSILCLWGNSILTHFLYVSLLLFTIVELHELHGTSLCNVLVASLSIFRMTIILKNR